MNSKAAMEMSVGTIVTIVLLMSVLVLGLFFAQKIFGGANSAIDMTNDELQSQLTELFGNDNTIKLRIFPSSKELKIRTGETEAIGIGVRNLATSDTDTEFKFEVIPKAVSTDCSLDQDDLLTWIYLIDGDGDLSVPVGEMKSAKVKFKIPEGTPLCTGSFQIKVYKEDGSLYDSDYVSIQAKAR